MLFSERNIRYDAYSAKVTVPYPVGLIAEKRFLPNAGESWPLTCLVCLALIGAH